MELTFPFQEWVENTNINVVAVCQIQSLSSHCWFNQKCKNNRMSTLVVIDTLQFILQPFFVVPDTLS